MKEGKVAPLIKEFYPEYYIWDEYPMDKCITITTNEAEWGILGNLYPTPLVVSGVEFVSSEQLFQMMKFTDPEILNVLYNTRGLTPKMKAKKFENKGFRRPDWGQIIVDCMKFCLQTKYDQSEEFRKSLQDTTGFIIVEDQTNRPRKTPDSWGVKPDGDKYVGSNLLGRLLMELRDNGKLDYKLPDDIFEFLKHIK